MRPQRCEHSAHTAPLSDFSSGLVCDFGAYKGAEGDYPACHGTKPL